MKFVAVAILAAVAFQAVAATVYFEETFSDGDGWESRWVEGNTGKEQGKFVRRLGDFYGDEEDSWGIATGEDARHYALSSKLAEPFSNKDKDLVLQFSVRHAQKLDCGGGYIKLLAADLDQAAFNGDSPYYIMFGPDICGPGTRKTHVIFGYKGENHLIKKDVRCESDQLTHLYTLIVHPDNTYEVKIDGKSKQTGSLKEDWDMLAAKEIKDPDASKPDDWVDDAEIPDPEDVKPADWDDVPEMIADPDAEKPDDWDDELDGDWEAPMIDNPEWKGEWKPAMIPNPDYKGPWVHPMIANPDYVDDDELYVFDNIGAVGFDLWQVKAGSIFDNILVTDSVEEAEAAAEKHYTSLKDAEKSMFDAAEEERKAKEEEERKKRDEERKKRDEEERLKREQEEALESDDEEWESDVEEEVADDVADIKADSGKKDEL